jgi:protoheme ferro-lyase
MLVKSYEEVWFREPIVKYLKLKGKDVESETDKIVFKILFKYLNDLHE